MQQADVAAPQALAARPALASYVTGLWVRLPDEGPALSLRLVCYLAALACFSVAPSVPALHNAGPPMKFQIDAVLAVTLLVAGLACFYLAVRATLPRWLDRLGPRRRTLLIAAFSGALCASLVSVGVLATLPLTVARPHHYGNDAVAATECATHLVLQGQNPYTAFDVRACFARHGLNALYTTPLQAGAFAHTGRYPAAAELLRAFASAQRAHARRPAAFESFYSYPAGSFLLPAAFAALGWHDLSSFYLLWAVFAYGVLALQAPRRWRPWLPALAGGNLPLWANLANGQSNVLAVFLLLAGWTTWRRPRLSSVLMGAALATRQEAWFFAPYYLVLVGYQRGWRSAASRLAVLGGVFALVNAPFIVLAPGVWLHGVLGPLRDPMYPLGEGVIALATSGVLPLWPHPIYTGLELVALVACLLLYLRTGRRQPGTGLVLALVPLVFAWRSLFTYFYVALPLVCLWAILADLTLERDAPLVRPDSALPGQTVAGAAGPPGRTEDTNEARDGAEWPAVA